MKRIKANKQLTIYKRRSDSTATLTIPEMIDYRNRGLSYAEIGKMAGITKVSAYNQLKRYSKVLDSITVYKNNVSDILSYHQARILNGISDNDITDASLQQKAVSYGVLVDKQRLHDGLSTSNLSVFSSIIREAHRETVPIPQHIDNEAPVTEPENEN